MKSGCLKIGMISDVQTDRGPPLIDTLSRSMQTKTAFIPYLSRSGLFRQRASQFTGPGNASLRCSPGVRLRVARVPRHMRSIVCMGVDIDQKNSSERVDVASEVDKGSVQSSLTAEQYGLGAAYVGCIVFTLFVAPGSWDDPGEIGKIISGQLGDTNDLFFAIFNLVGAASVNFAALLNAGAPRQKKLPTDWFSFAGLFVGFGALGPYLIGRDYAPKVSAEEVTDRGFISRVLESRLLSIGTVIYAMWAYVFALGFFTPGTIEFHDVVLYASGVDLFRLLSNDRWACFACLDLFAMCAATWGPLTEDMSRRGWFTEGRKLESVFTALSFMLVPVLGPAIYLASRPRLPSREGQESS